MRNLKTPWTKFYKKEDLEFDVGDRGKWRKYNPYNPYNEDEPDKKQDLNVESLDDLFEDDSKEETTKEDSNVALNENDNVSKKEDIIEPINKIENDAPVLPQEDRDEEDIMSVDIQKQLEAKFDELFGSFEEDEETSAKNS